MNKAIVTGATGFIGMFLIRELLKQNVEVIAVVRKYSKNIRKLDNMNLRIVECNIVDFCNLSKLVVDRDIDAIFHTAWQGVSDMEARNQDVQIQNLKSTLDLIDVCHEMRVKTFVGCGSMHEAEALIEMSENKTISNMGFMYKSAKTSAHWMGKAKCGQYGIRFFWPLINTYGEEERSERLVNTVICKIFNNESPVLSAGNQFYDFVHVSDVARALYLIAEKGVDGVNYVIGSGNAKPLKEFLEVIGQVANRLNGNTDIPLGYGKITSNVVALPIDAFDVTRLTEDTGFVPLVSFEEGIERTARWIHENK